MLTNDVYLNDTLLEGCIREGTPGNSIICLIFAVLAEGCGRCNLTGRSFGSRRSAASIYFCIYLLTSFISFFISEPLAAHFSINMFMVT